MKKSSHPVFAISGAVAKKMVFKQYKDRRGNHKVSGYEWHYCLSGAEDLPEFI